MELLKQGQQSMIKYFLIILLLCGCAADIEDYPPKWILASTYLPKMEGYRNAGFFTIDNKIYSHYCDSHGNMVRIRFNEETKTWKRFKYETFGCMENKNWL